MASRMLGNTSVAQRLFVTIGETFGVSQRGGSVMSHLRISEKSAWSPQIPAARLMSLWPSNRWKRYG